MNLFQSILDKAQNAYTGSSFYKGMEKLGSSAYDWANPNQDPIQRFLDDPKIEPSKKQALFSDLQAGKPKDAISNYVSQKYYPQAQFQEALPMVQPTFPTTGKEGVVGGAAKMIGNIPSSLYNLGAGTVNIGATALQEGVGPTASMLGKGIVKGIGQGAEGISQAYQEGGVLGATSKAIEGTQKLITQDPAMVFAPQMAKGAGTLTKMGGKALVTGVEKVAPKVVQGAKTAGNIVASPFKSIYTTGLKYTGIPEEISGIQSAIKPKQKVKNGVVQRSQKQIENEIQLTNSLIRGSGKKPIDLETYAKAQKETLEGLGEEINRLTGQPLYVDVSKSAGKLRVLANSDAVKILDPSEGSRILKLADDLEKRGTLPLADAEAMNQYINDVLKSTTSTASEAYKRALQSLVVDLRDGLDFTISNIPNQFKNLKKSYGAVRNVYGDTIARQIVFNRQNLGGLIDSFGAIEGFGNIVSGAGKIVTGKFGEGVVDIGKGVTQNAVGRFIKSKNDPNNIIRSIFNKGGLKSAPPDIKTKELLMLPAPSGKATGARNIRVNQPKDTSRKIIEKVNKEKVKRPGTTTKQEASIEKKLVEARERENMLKNVKNDITSATKAARYGGTGNTRVEAVIDAKLAKGEITQQEALSILDDVKTNPRYEYIDQKALDKYIEKIKGGKVESFDELIAPKPQPKEIVTKTHKQIYDKLNQMANDGRYGDKSWNDLADEFKKQTGKDIMDTSFDDFGPDGMLKPPKKVVAPKQFKMKNDRDIDGLENYINKGNKKYNFYEFSENQYMFKSKNNELLEVRTDNNGYITSKKILGELDSDGYLKTKNTKATPKKVVAPKKSTKGIVAPKKIENTPIVKKEAVKPNERSYNLIAVNERTGEKTILTKTPTTQDKAITMKNKFSDREGRRIQLEEVTPKPIVKNLQKTEKSATIGDMETKKLIEEAKTLGKYDNSYDVVKGKKLYRGGSEDGVFWTDDIDIAKSFGDEGVIEKTITIKKPLDVRSKGIRDYIKKNTDIKIDYATSAYSRSLPEFKKLMKWAKENGYDGIIGKTSDNGLNFTGNEFVVLK